MPVKKQHRQLILYLLTVLSVIFLGVFAGFHYGGFNVGNFGDSGRDGNVLEDRYATMADAHLLCEARAREVFGARIRSLMIDNHSSRLDKKAGLFRVFMEADLYANDNRSGAVVRHYINCFTRTDRVALASFQYAKDGEAMKDPGGSVFGF